jgi:hypothetical protein
MLLVVVEDVMLEEIVLEEMVMEEVVMFNSLSLVLPKSKKKTFWTAICLPFACRLPAIYVPFAFVLYFLFSLFFSFFCFFLSHEIQSKLKVISL